MINLDQDWLDKLRPGDKVAVFDSCGRRIYSTEVVRRTAKRIFTGNQIFRSNGMIYGASAPCYNDRHLRPITDRGLTHN